MRVELERKGRKAVARGASVALLLAAACATGAPLGGETPAREAPRAEVAAQVEGAPNGRCGEEAIAAAEPSSGLLESLAPYERWPALGAREQGLLLPARSRFGVEAAWTPMMGQLVFSASLAPYVFTSRGANPWVLYFESSGEGENFLRNWQRRLPDGTVVTFDAAMLAPSTQPNRFGLSRVAHVVEVEVNGGRGAAPDLHFVATDVRVLDRTPALPLDPERALETARGCFDALVSAARPALEAALERSGAALDLGASWEPAREQTLDAIAPSFDPDTRTLRVVFARRVVRTHQRRDSRTIAPSCPEGAPCMPPREEVRILTRGYGADLAEELVFDANGRLVSARAHGPVALSTEALVRAGLVRDRTSY